MSVALSRSMSLVLRHKARSMGLAMDAGGWVRVDELLELPVMKKAGGSGGGGGGRGGGGKGKGKAPAAAGAGPSPVLVLQCVVESDKQRFSVKWEEGGAAAGSGSGTALTLQDLQVHAERLVEYYAENVAAGRALFVRANQGHSLEGVDVDLVPITVDTLDQHPREIVHGTSAEAWLLIAKSGCLKKMGRTHIHFAPVLSSSKAGAGAASAGASATTLHERYSATENAPGGATPGLRKVGAAPLGIFLDLHAAVKAGHAFFVSANGVVLCPGNGEDGSLPLAPEYTLRVVSLSTGEPVAGFPLEDAPDLKKARTE